MSDRISNYTHSTAQTIPSANSTSLNGAPFDAFSSSDFNGSITNSEIASAYDNNSCQSSHIPEHSAHLPNPVPTTSVNIFDQSVSVEDQHSIFEINGSEYQGNGSLCDLDESDSILHENTNGIHQPTGSQMEAGNAHDVLSDHSTSTTDGSQTVGDELENNSEIPALLRLISISGRAGMSRELTEELLACDAVKSPLSYHQLVSIAQRQINLAKPFVPMCRKGHMCATGIFANKSTCQVPGCDEPMDLIRRFWYLKPSDQIRALLSAPCSFQEILNGCERAHCSLQQSQGDFLMDYYDGSMFRNRFRSSLSNWSREGDLYIFTSFSTDGFEVWKGRVNNRDIWPLVFVILNFDFDHRFRASNVLNCGSVPGSHEGSFFDTFLTPIIDDLCQLEKGMEMSCADGITRTIFLFNIITTADFPAATKILGYLGHNSRLPCRHCYKRSQSIEVSRGMFTVPDVRPQIMQRIARSNNESDVDHLYQVECHPHRTSNQLKNVWDELRVASENNDLSKIKSISDRTGIKRCPEISRLNMDFVNGSPYDPMHQCLIGFVRHLLFLLLGRHPKSVLQNAAYIQSEAIICTINSTIEQSQTLIPSGWGRAPLSLNFIHQFKAEDYKNFGMYYGPVLFSARLVSSDIAKLWALVSRMLHIVFDPTPHVSSIRELRSHISLIVALFDKIFCYNPSLQFCHTPTCHVMLHLPDMLQQCGPLIGVSQFLMERVAGESAPKIKSRKRPEASLYHRNHLEFCLRMCEGGLSLNENRSAGRSMLQKGRTEFVLGTATEASAIGRKVKVYCRGKTPVNDRDRISRVKAYLYGVAPDSWEDIRLERLFLCSTAYVKKFDEDHEYDALDFESVGAFKRRGRENDERPRQRCCVAAEFESSNENYAQTNDGLTYYGFIAEILEIEYTYLLPGHGNREEAIITLVKVNWENALQIDNISGFPFSDSSRSRSQLSPSRTVISIEHISCLQRCVGIMEINNRQYYLDQCVQDKLKSIDGSGTSYGGLRR